MRLQYLGAPALPFAEQRGQLLAITPAAAQQFLGARRRTSARVEQRDIHLTPRERLVQHGQVADDESEEREPDAGLDHHQDAAHPRDWGDIAETKRKERLTAQVEMVGDRTTAGDVEAGAEASLKQSEPGDKARRPCGQEHEQRQRPEEAQVGFATTSRSHAATYRRPYPPRDAIERPCRP